MSNIKDIGEAAKGFSSLPVVTLLFFIVVGQLLLQWRADEQDADERKRLNEQLTQIFTDEVAEEKRQTEQMQRFADAMSSLAEQSREDTRIMAELRQQEISESSEILKVMRELADRCEEFER